MNSCECLLCQTRCCLILSCFFQISAGRTHSAAWTTPCPPQRIPGVPVPLQLGTPDKIPASCSTLRECPIEDIQGRLKLLHHFSDLIYSSWRLLPLTTIAQVYRGCIKYRREWRKQTAKLIFEAQRNLILVNKRKIWRTDSEKNNTSKKFCSSIIVVQQKLILTKFDIFTGKSSWDFMCINSRLLFLCEQCFWFCRVRCLVMPVGCQV